MPIAGKSSGTGSQRALAASLVVVVLFAIQFANPSRGGLWLRTFYDSLHVPLFGVIAVCLLLVTPAAWGFRTRMVAVSGLVIGLSALSEAAQIPVERDASIADFLANLAGAAGFLIVAVTCMRNVPVSRMRARLLRLVGTAFVIAPLVPLALVTAAYAERASALPSLVRFDSQLSRVFVHPQGARLNVKRDQSSGRAFAEIVLLEGTWPGVTFDDIWPNWEGYSDLVVEIENPDAEELSISIRVNDRQHHEGSQEYGDRFNRKIALAPGLNVIRISLHDVELAPESRKMDLADISKLIIFASREQAGRRFVIHSVYLE